MVKMQKWLNDNRMKGRMLMKEKIRQFMVGRYGTDAFGGFTLGVTIVFIVLDVIFKLPLFGLLAVITLFFSYFRMFSRNIPKRSAENGRYLFYRQKYFGWWDRKKRQLLDLRTHHIYRCPQCRQKIRIPRGKGMIEVRCPKCNTTFKKKS